MIQPYIPALKWLRIGLDCSSVIGILFLLTWNKNDEISSYYRVLAVVTVFLMLGIYKLLGYYNFRSVNFSSIWVLLKAWCTVIMALIVIGFVTKTSWIYSREVIIIWSFLGIFPQIIGHYFCQLILNRYPGEKLPTLMVGAGSLAKHLIEHIRNNSWLPDSVVGIVENNDDKRSAWADPETPLLGKIDDLCDLIDQHGIRRIYITLPLSEADAIHSISKQTAINSIDIIWAPDIFGVNLLNHQVRELGGVPIIALSESPLVGSLALVKSVMDKVLAGLGLIVISPLMLIVAAAIKLTSKGPVLFKQERHGWDGKVFTVYKFRSMYLHEEEAGVVTPASKSDDRITPLGHLIRRISIDELPQLFNVLNGSMSLVGPRPHAVVHNDFYINKINAYMQRHRVKPGVTGLAQVNGFRGETQSIEKMQGRLQFDLQYIDNWSLWLDIKILIKTIFVVFDEF